MATRFSNGVFGVTNASNGQRNWFQFVYDTMVTDGGWVQTADTGQVTISAITTPGGANTKNGYIIIRTNDSLHATRPVFIRVDTGAGSAANNPGLWFTIGTGSDGAGTITGIRFNGGAAAAPQFSGTATATLSNSYGSAGGTGAWGGCLFGLTGGGAATFAFHIERSKDTAGADDGTGILLWVCTAGVMVRCQWIFWANVTQPSNETGISTIVSGLSPSSFGGDIGVGLGFPFTGYARPAGLGFTFIPSADLADQGSMTVSIYGSNHTYKQGGATTVNCNLNSAAGSNLRTAIRYE